MALALVARNVQFQGEILGTMIPIDIIILNSYKSTIDFTLFGSTYTFTIERWAKRGLNSFLRMFHSIPRDSALYGVMTEDATGNYQFYEDYTDLHDNGDGTFTAGAGAKALTLIQKLNIIEQGCRDVISCLNQIGTMHQRSILEYCVWYREGHPVPGTYVEYITLVTSHSVAHNEFMAPNVTWSLVEFHY
jgi:hypothetical protein